MKMLDSRDFSLQWEIIYTKRKKKTLFPSQRGRYNTSQPPALFQAAFFPDRHRYLTPSSQLWLGKVQDCGTASAHTGRLHENAYK